MGPASAVAATCDRIGWRWDGFSKFVDHRAREWDVALVCPTTFRAVVHDATRQWTWRTLGERLPAFSARGPWGPFLTPILRAIGGDGGERPSRGAAVRSCAAGGEWPQARLAAAGLVDQRQCLWCGAEDGTLAHRYWRCGVLAAA